MYTLAVVLKENFITDKAQSVGAFESTDYLIFTLLGLLLILTLVFSSMLAYSTAHYIIRPLRMLNNKMVNIILSQDEDAELTNNDEESSFELTLLYNQFKDLISAKKFENNNFMMKPDAMAVLDLAEACNIFDG